MLCVKAPQGFWPEQGYVGRKDEDGFVRIARKIRFKRSERVNGAEQWSTGFRDMAAVPEHMSQ